MGKLDACHLGTGVRADWTSVQGNLTTEGGQAIGVIGSNRTTNEENYLLQKFARMVLGTNNIDHHRTADFPAFASALARQAGSHGQHARRVQSRRRYLLIGNDPTEQHPLLAWQIRTNVRLHRARLYVVNSSQIKLRRQATTFAQIAPAPKAALLPFLAGNDAAMRLARQRHRMADAP